MGTTKPLGRKAYGSIPHLYGSRLGVGDHHCHKGQHDICTVSQRDKHDRIIVSEKLDGSSCAVALIDNKVVAVTRAGHYAFTSPHAQHHYFNDWVMHNEDRFRAVLNRGERICGEWMMQAHSIRYALGDLEPFFVFDIMINADRLPWDVVTRRLNGVLQTVPVISDGPSVSAADAMSLIDDDSHSETYGKCGALEQVEGFVWRVEYRNEFNFIAKWVRPDKIDGRYLGNHETVWNVTPDELQQRYAKNRKKIP